VGFFVRVCWGLWLGYKIMKNGSVTIPAKIRKKYGFVKGIKVNFVVKDGGVFIVPVDRPKDRIGVDEEK